MRRRTPRTGRRGRKAPRAVRGCPAASPTSRGPGRSARAIPRSGGGSHPPCGRAPSDPGSATPSAVTDGAGGDSGACAPPSYLSDFERQRGTIRLVVLSPLVVARNVHRLHITPNLFYHPQL